MQFLNHLTYLAISVSALAVHPPAAESTSCVPSDFTWQHARGIQACQHQTVQGGEDIYSCNTFGTIYLNVAKNRVSIALDTVSEGRSLTVHASCVVAGQQVAHFDLHSGAATGIIYNHLFPAFNRDCPAGAKMTISYYDLTKEQQDDCARHPIKPIN